MTTLLKDGSVVRDESDLHLLYATNFTRENVFIFQARNLLPLPNDSFSVSKLGTPSKEQAARRWGRILRENGFKATEVRNVELYDGPKGTYYLHVLTFDTGEKVLVVEYW